MNGKIKYVSNISIAKDYAPAALFGKAQAEAVRKFHKSFPAYEPTKLYSLDNLARIMGVGKFYVKDENSRFGLNAFKGLGGSYAIGKILSERAGISEEEMTYTRLQQEDVKAATRGMTFVTATILKFYAYPQREIQTGKITEGLSGMEFIQAHKGNYSNLLLSPH